MLKSSRELLASSKIVATYLRTVLPLMDGELARWQALISARMNGELKRQALASIADKRFHCQGGCFYALYPRTDRAAFCRFIVALQTISDYLDNLCDRVAGGDETAFRQLHLAMTDAVTPRPVKHDYYAFYQYKDDNGYLETLVATCQNYLTGLPSYCQVAPYTIKLAELYSQLQTYKHLDQRLREQAMLRWLRDSNDCPELQDWEFAAATGSTLGLFALTAAAADPFLTGAAAAKLYRDYFPWLCAMHIQLDYLIDRQEDELNADLNFISYYTNESEITDRLTFIYGQARRHAEDSAEPEFTLTILRGLLGLYLSDKKMDADKSLSAALLNTGGGSAKFLYFLCRLLRRCKII